jgi:hypothetical protein
LFEAVALVVRLGSNGLRMKLERFRRRAVCRPNAQNGVRDIASLLIMIGIIREFRGAFRSDAMEWLLLERNFASQLMNDGSFQDWFS